MRKGVHSIFEPQVWKRQVLYTQFVASSKQMRTLFWKGSNAPGKQGFNDFPPILERWFLNTPNVEKKLNISVVVAFLIHVVK